MIEFGGAPRVFEDLDVPLAMLEGAGHLSLEELAVIPLAECMERGVYRLRARNFRLAVYDGHGAFLGIRTKFGHRFLDSEFHAGLGAPFGTAYPYERVAMLPDGIDVRRHEPTIDRMTGRPVEFDSPVQEGGRGWYFTDTGEASTAITPVSMEYRPLFQYLDEVERWYQPDDPPRNR